MAASWSFTALRASANGAMWPSAAAESSCSAARVGSISMGYRQVNQPTVRERSASLPCGPGTNRVSRPCPSISTRVHVCLFRRQRANATLNAVSNTEFAPVRKAWGTAPSNSSVICADASCTRLRSSRTVGAFSGSSASAGTCGSRRGSSALGNGGRELLAFSANSPVSTACCSSCVHRRRDVRSGASCSPRYAAARSSPITFHDTPSTTR